ncbi:MAG TPA: PilT/PilU family type 4a pilus ATPase [Deltaproteobacteria bacterium]|nr:PilT/PilU family type 4a pilus ATPase [Deltaproteobacteria bacterium]
MIKHGGDELVIEAGAAPRFFAGGRPLKLFLRPLADDRHQALLDELLSSEAREDLSGSGRTSLAHAVPELGGFAVDVRGPEGERIRIVRVIDGGDEAPDAVQGVGGLAPAAPTADAAGAGSVGPSSGPLGPSSGPLGPSSGPLGPSSGPGGWGPAAGAVAPSVGSSAPRAASLQPLQAGEPPEGLVALLGHAAEVRASDLHLSSGQPAIVRIDGQLSALGDAVADAEQLVLPLLDEAGRARLGERGAVDLAVQLPRGERFRGHVYRHDGGIAAAFRVLRPVAPPLAGLGLPTALLRCVVLAHGLVLFCGPTGSGKSTSMAALIREVLASQRGLLITLEDPIEYTFTAGPGALVRQRQIGRHVIDFPSGLRDALREDPDVLLVGEMRDPTTIALALTAAETGHLVFASLHSRTAPSAIERIVDAYPPERQRQVRVQLADALRMVVSQRLLPRADGLGRVPAVEILSITQGAANLIREGKTPQLVSVIQTGSAQGMIPLERSVRELLRRRVITEETARSVLA